MDPFIKSCYDGDLEGVRTALKNGADVNSKDWTGRNGLAWAWLNKHTAVADLLMAQEGLGVDTVDCAKAEILVNLCSQGDLEGVRAAIQSGTDVNSKDSSGWSGLMRALERNHFEVVNFFLEHKDFDITAVNEDGDTALHIAALQDNDDALAKLLTRCDSAMVNQQDKATRTPLYWAADNSVKCVRVFLSDSRTDPNIAANYNIFRNTPLTLAVKCHRLDIVELLLRDERTDPNIKDCTEPNINVSSDGNTPLMAAIKANQVDIVKLILSDPRVNLDCEGAEEGHPELAKLVEEERERRNA